MTRVESTFLILIAIETDCPGRPSTRVVRRHDGGGVPCVTRVPTYLTQWRIILSYLILYHLVNSATWQRQGSQPTSMTANYAFLADGPSPHTVQMGEGPPTKEELLVYYPAKFTWKQLKTFVNSGYFCTLYLSIAIVESLSPGILVCSSATRDSSSDMIVGLEGSRPSMAVMVVDFYSPYCISHHPL